MTNDSTKSIYSEIGHRSAGGSDNDHSTHDSREPRDGAVRSLYLAMGLCFLFMLVEFYGGIVGHSLAVITDALHMLTDVFSFALSIFAASMATKSPTNRFTFGFKRAEVLCALLSTMFIWILTAYLLYEASLRILQYRAGNMKDVDGKLMFCIAVLGIVFNLILERVLGGHSHGGSHGHSHSHAHGQNMHTMPPPLSSEASPTHEHRSEHRLHEHDHEHGHDHGHEHGHDHGKEHGHDHGKEHGHVEIEPSQYGSIPVQGEQPARNLNIDAAYLHVIGDLIQSVGVALAGLLIWHDPSWKIADPLCTWLFGLIVMYTTLQMLWSNVTVLLEGVPEGLDVQHIKTAFLGIANDHGENIVTEVHDLHVWSVTSGSPILTAHVSHLTSMSSPYVLTKIHAVCLHMGIRHVTVQALPEGSSVGGY